jgi:hypothetical protein
MGTAAILAMLLAAVGPIWLPFAFARAGRGAAYAFCLTNLITLLPMIGIVALGRFVPSSPGNGVPNDVGWFVITLLFIALAFWSLLASVAIATSDVFRKR